MMIARKAVVSVDALGAVVRPGIVFADKQAVTIQNQTDAPIQVFLPEGAESQVTTIQAGATQSVTLNAGEGVYAYAVFSQETGDFARGNSSPRIIIR
jgi:hypothetical protein